ncbi:hypothetical protein Godav_027837 [Gossypium davidsonii]|uniref:Aminotransferase-like plant mobile domain-containing protein n=1 Tax=Gossypium davidsonii TaxID=34287 RepID=A0A7J8RXC0_GOSDV|nr:hypothetical protein [Gossypium davidsonii]
MGPYSLDRDGLIMRHIPRAGDDSTEWLLKLVDFRTAGELSWGSVMLATLYREMCEATKPNKAKIGGCLSLQQLWARLRFPFLCP